MTFETYIKELQGNLSRGNATEHTHRPALKILLESLQPGLVATNEPRRIKAGAPDYILTQGNIPLGYVEAKDVGENLSKVERSDQLKRYREALPNLVLTDYVEFRWYVDGELRTTARIAESRNGTLLTDEDGIGEVARLLRAFLLKVTPTVGTPRELAERMAAIAREVRGQIIRTFDQEGERGQLHTQLEAFRQTLIPDLAPNQFADMYAQTIAYGLFAARTMDAEGDFSRMAAGYHLPRTNPFLRRLFNEIAGPDLDDRVSWLVDDLAELLRRADMSAILEDFGRRTRQEDPVVHFYETFLAAYDPKERERRGVYYTPEPVVAYIVRSVDSVLRRHFGRALGLADPKTIVLDPATGTATFLYHVIRLIHERLQEQAQLGVWSNYVRDNLLPRIFGFELLMAPYTIAHMKLGILLRELGYDFSSEERLRVYLTNTLEQGVHSRETIGFAEFITQEADAATEVKEETPIEVIIGNPPYSGHSANKGEWIRSLIHEDYIKHYPELRKPAQAKWLSDDYVKFIRFGQWRVEKTGRGVLAFITNHSYLDNPTFRGMRESLMRTFTDIYLLDLHGNAKKKERTPEGGKDENVFDIQQGVAIGILVREPGKSGPARVYHANLWGLREGKYEWLADQSIEATEWTKLAPNSPAYLFAPQDTNLLAEYEQGWKIPDVMDQYGDPAPGIVTTHDQFAISWTAEDAKQKVNRFLRTQSEEEARAMWRLCSQSQWNYQRAKTMLDAGDWEDRVCPVLYRPFDSRWTVYDSNVAVHRRERVMNHILGGENLSLIVPRQSKNDFGVYATDRIGTHKTVAAYDINYYFPLYLYPLGDDLLSVMEEERRPNLSPQFTAELSEKLRLRFVPDGRGDLVATFGPEDVFDYAYAVFHSPTYRERYAEFLKRDFPRLPLTSDRALFAALAEKGAALVRLHLMNSSALDILITSFPEDGDNEVERVRYTEPREGRGGRVYLNKDQYFDGVAPDVWEFRVGGYQVLDKWLKDRKGHTLSFEDIMHYQRIVVALSQTQRIMQEIDGLVTEWPLR